MADGRGNIIYTPLVIFVAAALLVMGIKLYDPEKESTKAPPISFGPELEQRLQAHIQTLAGTIGERNLLHHGQLEAAATYIEQTLKGVGLAVGTQQYVVAELPCRNLEVEITGKGQPEEIIIVAAHYDSAAGTPGANDNASGVAAMLEIARAFADRPLGRTLRFVAFVNEEPPFFQTRTMGSYLYASRIKDRADKVLAMFSLETLGYFTQERQSQRYPFKALQWLYTDRGNFLAFVSDLDSAWLMRRSLKAFRKATDLPARGLAAPTWVEGVDHSDQWSFWRRGYPGIMVTDTAFYRYPHYHSPEDTPDKVSIPTLVRTVKGLTGMIQELAGEPPPPPSKRRSR